jgi:quinol monooxygenase YgiN
MDSAMDASQMIAVMGLMRFPPDRVADVLPHVRTLLEASRLEEGCVAYHVGVDIEEPGVLRVSEIWADADALERHVGAPHIAPWRAAQLQCGIIQRQYQVMNVAAMRTV